VIAKFTKAEDLIRAGRNEPGEEGGELLRKAKKALKQAETKANRAAKGKAPKLSSDCAAALKDAADGVVGGLGV